MRGQALCPGTGLSPSLESGFDFPSKYFIHHCLPMVIFGPGFAYFATRHMQTYGAQTGLNRYSGKKTIKPINFLCFAPEAVSVAIAGDFNNWSHQANPMQRQPDGGWIAQVPLSHGPHRYYFIVDGVRTIDPRAQGTVRNEYNDRVSLITVS